MNSVLIAYPVIRNSFSRFFFTWKTKKKLYIFLVSNKIAFISVLELWWSVFLIVSYVLGIKIMPLSI